MPRDCRYLAADTASGGCDASYPFALEEGHKMKIRFSLLLLLFTFIVPAAAQETGETETEIGSRTNAIGITDDLGLYYRRRIDEELIISLSGAFRWETYSAHYEDAYVLTVGGSVRHAERIRPRLNQLWEFELHAAEAVSQRDIERLRTQFTLGAFFGYEYFLEPYFAVEARLGILRTVREYLKVSGSLSPYEAGAFAVPTTSLGVNVYF